MKRNPLQLLTTFSILAVVAVTVVAIANPSLLEQGVDWLMSKF